MARSQESWSVSVCIFPPGLDCGGRCGQWVPPSCFDVRRIWSQNRKQIQSIWCQFQKRFFDNMIASLTLWRCVNNPRFEFSKPCNSWDLTWDLTTDAFWEKPSRLRTFYNPNTGCLTGFERPVASNKHWISYFRFLKLTKPCKSY